MARKWRISTLKGLEQFFSVIREFVKSVSDKWASFFNQLFHQGAMLTYILCQTSVVYLFVYLCIYLFIYLLFYHLLSILAVHSK